MKRLAWLGAALLAVGCGDVDVFVTTEGKPATDEVTVAKFNVEGAPTVDFSVPGMHCESCVAHVEGILAAQPGVKDVEVDLDSLTAKVAVDEQEFDGEKAVAALVDMQFEEAKLITAEAAAAAKAAKPVVDSTAVQSTDEATKDAKQGAEKS